MTQQTQYYLKASTNCIHCNKILLAGQEVFTTSIQHSDLSRPRVRDDFLICNICKNQENTNLSQNQQDRLWENYEQIAWNRDLNEKNCYND